MTFFNLFFKLFFLISEYFLGYLTFVFDIDVETSMLRVGKEKDRMESAGKEFHNRVRYGYLELAKLEPNRIKVLDATKSIDEIHQDVINIITCYDM